MKLLRQALTELWAMYRDLAIEFLTVTRCRLCSRYVWVWQRHERRPMGVEVENNNQVLIEVGGSCTVHRACKGKPISNVKVEVC